MPGSELRAFGRRGVPGPGGVCGLGCGQRREPQARASGKPQDQTCGKHSCNQYHNLPVSQSQTNHIVPAWNTIYKLLTESQPQYVV